MVTILYHIIYPYTFIPLYLLFFILPDIRECVQPVPSPAYLVPSSPITTVHISYIICHTVHISYPIHDNTTNVSNQSINKAEDGSTVFAINIHQKIHTEFF